jgi:hypothetical protein
MAVSAGRVDFLVDATVSLVGQARAVLYEWEFVLSALRTTHDERAERIVEALEMTLREPAGPGTVRHVVEAAEALLTALRNGGDF